MAYFSDSFSSQSSSIRDPIVDLIAEFSKLPGIGEKSATRIVYHLLKQPKEVADSLIQSLKDAKSSIQLCVQCFQFSNQEFCSTCADTSRNISQICVVERPTDIRPIENSGIFKGYYHVLHGVLSPIDGIGPDELKIKELFERVQKLGAPEQCEIIFAINPSLEGEATASYLARTLRNLGVKISQLAYGLSIGGQLEYTDRLTIAKAMENRLEFR